jgi:N4-gp56 family major capsid protein
MAVTVNVSSQYAGAIERKIDRTALQVAQRYLVLYQFADKRTLEHGRGTVWTAIRWNRLPLAQAPIAEGVPPPPNQLTFTQVAGVALQWAGRIVFTDVATITIQQDLLRIAGERLGMQLAETKERNGYNALMAGTQVNYVASAGARASLVVGNNLDPQTVTRTATNLQVVGAPFWNGQTGETIQRSIDYNVNQADKTSTKAAEHLVAIGDPRTLQDFRNNPLVVQTYQYSDHVKLYTNQHGYWGSMTFVTSNILPNWTGRAQVNGANAVGSLATATYTVQVTGWDNQNFYESQIYQLSADVAVTTGGIVLTMPSTPGFTYAVYVGQGSAAPTQNLGVTSSGPTTGPYAGQAIMIPPSTVVTITDIGLFQIPPAAPATAAGTVYPTFVFGKEAFACLKLESVEWNRLYNADKSDPHNQLRVIGYKYMEGWVILNQQFMARIESTASSTGAFA